MLKNCQKLLLAVVLVLGASGASATSPCMDPDGCLDELPVGWLVVFEMRIEHCAPTSSLSDEEKERLVEEEFKNDGSPGYVQRLRATAYYPEFRERVVALLRQRDGDAKIEELCRETQRVK